MEFEPIYYAERANYTKNGTGFDKEKINIINPKGHTGIVTLWTKPEWAWNRLRERFPAIFDHENSPVVALTSLYGNGLPQMLANLAYNPQITNLAVMGKDTPAVPSFAYLENFLTKGVIKPDSGQFGTIVDTQFPIDYQLTPKLFDHLRLARFNENELEKLVTFAHEKTQGETKPRFKIEFAKPKFSTYPSNMFSHTIVAETPTKAWMDMLHRINRYGNEIIIDKGPRMSLFDLKVFIVDPSPESSETLAKYGHDLRKFEDYRRQILNSELPMENTKSGSGEKTYTYGNRLMKHFGLNTLDAIVERLKADPSDNKAFTTTWDVKLDTVYPADKGSAPCLTDLYFVRDPKGKLFLSADFRSHSAVSGWLMNVYQLRALQEYVSKETGIEPGSMTVKSRWIAIDPQDSKTVPTMEIVNKNRTTPIDANDPRGYFTCRTEKDQIVLEHFAPNGIPLDTYVGSSTREIKDQLRRNDVLDNPDHAIFIGYQLARAELKIKGKLEEL